MNEMVQGCCGASELAAVGPVLPIRPEGPAHRPPELCHQQQSGAPLPASHSVMLKGKSVYTWGKAQAVKHSVYRHLQVKELIDHCVHWGVTSVTGSCLLSR